MSTNRAKKQNIKIRRVGVFDDTSTPFIEFFLNPTEIKESRGGKYSFSEAQGQILPYSQYGMIEKTELSFTAKFFSHKGLPKVLNRIRSLCLPRKAGRLAHYDQQPPYEYILDIGSLTEGIGAYQGVFTKVDINHLQYGKTNFRPIHFDVDFTFILTVSRLNSLSRTMNSLQ